MDRDKLAKLRKKKAENKALKHKELIDSNASIKEAIVELSAMFNERDASVNSLISEQLQDLKQSITFSDDIKRLEDSLAQLYDKPLEVKNFADMIDKIGAINNADVIEAVNILAENIESNTISQDPKDFQPVRRVIKKGNRLIFDDDLMQVNIASPGGGGSGFPTRLTRGNSVAVVNPDGTPIAGGGGGGGDASAVNQTNGLQKSQLVDADGEVATVTGGKLDVNASINTTGLAIEANQQTDALTDAELRATPIEVDTGLTPQTDALTNTQLRATPVPMSGTVNPTPSGAAAQALTNDTSTAYEASSVTKAGAGTVYGLTGYNSKTSDQFFQFFNSTTVPADATAPVITIRVAASSNFSVDFGVYGRRFSTGISWSNSSTGPTKTIGSADIFADINYV